MKKLSSLVVAILILSQISMLGQTQDFREILGLNLNSEKVQVYFNSLGQKPEITENKGYIFKKSGMEINTKNDTIVAIFIYAKNYNGPEYWPYTGFIPYDLNFNDTRKIIEQKLGQPTQVIDGIAPTKDYPHSMDMNCIWASPDIRIKFKTDFRNPMNSKIGFIAFYKFN
jgi:hypothetical protein